MHNQIVTFEPSSNPCPNQINSPPANVIFSNLKLEYKLHSNYILLIEPTNN
jgi:hypothetical protein